MIKLIVSDVDGTLLEEGTPNLNPELFQVILKLKEKGVIFAAASGRQYESIREVFAPVENEMIFIADNGAYVVCRGREMESFFFDRSVLEETVAYVRKMKGFLLVESPEVGYTDSRDEAFITMLREGYNMKIQQVEDVLKLDIPVVKVAAYCQEDAQSMALPAGEHFKGRLNVMASGAHWVDFVRPDVDKGNALGRVQKLMKILPEETMAFGDNINDIGMLARAGESYAVENAREEVKRAAKHIAGRGAEDGVLKVLKRLLEQQ